MPTPLAWYFYQFPEWFQHVSVGFLFFVELAVPLLVLAPRRIRFFAAFAITLLQVLILLTGNYAFFNFLTIALCLFTFDDSALAYVLPNRIMERLFPSQQAGKRNVVWSAVCTSVASLILFTSGFENGGRTLRAALGADGRGHPRDCALRNRKYLWLFAVMTTSRPEIIIEGSKDGVTWLAYEFKFKAGELTRRPPWVEPHQPRLDWQMWFAALGNYRSDRWILQFLKRLLEGSPQVLGLLGPNPFPDAAPRYIRAQVYEYHFTTPEERKATGEWWHREWKGIYVPEISLH